MDVFVVCYGDYDELSIHGVATTLEKAMELLAKIDPNYHGGLRKKKQYFIKQLKTDTLYNDKTNPPDQEGLAIYPFGYPDD